MVFDEKYRCPDFPHSYANLLVNESICAGNLDLDGDGLTDGHKGGCNKAQWDLIDHFIVSGGDGGAPLVCEFDGKAVTVGIFSTPHDGCVGKGKPGIFSSVQYALPWIQGIINPTTSTTTTTTTTTSRRKLLPDNVKCHSGNPIFDRPCCKTHISEKPTTKTSTNSQNKPGFGKFESSEKSDSEKNDVNVASGSTGVEV